MVNSRIEDWSWTGDLVTARALAALPVVLEYAAPLLVEGGRFVAWKGAVSPEEDAAGLVAAEILGLERLAVHPVTPYKGSRDHTLHVFCKIAPTPERFPSACRHGVETSALAPPTAGRRGKILRFDREEGTAAADRARLETGLAGEGEQLWGIVAVDPETDRAWVHRLRLKAGSPP